MGIRTALVVCATSFLLGALTTNWIADSLTLWKSPVTDANLLTAAAYYALLSKMPASMLGALAAIVALAFVALGSSMWSGATRNLMFDGASMLLFSSAAYYWVSEVVPDLQIFMAHDPAEFTNAKTLPAAFGKPTLDLASAHLVCAVALTGVIVLQGGRLWVESEEAEEDAEKAKTTASEDDDDDSNVAPRHYHENDAVQRSPKQGSLRKKGSLGRRSSRKTSER